MNPSEKNTGLTADTLFLAPTRPAALWGVPYPACILNFVLTMELFILTKNIPLLGICIPLHGIFWSICYNDIRTFELLQLWCITKGASFLGQFFGQSHFRLWKSSSYSPLETAYRPSVSLLNRLKYRWVQRQTHERSHVKPLSRSHTA